MQYLEVLGVRQRQRLDSATAVHGAARALLAPELARAQRPQVDGAVAVAGGQRGVPVQPRARLVH